MGELDLGRRADLTPFVVLRAQYPGVFAADGVFGVYPYLLPCCFPAAMAVAAALLLRAVPPAAKPSSASHAPLHN